MNLPADPYDRVHVSADERTFNVTLEEFVERIELELEQVFEFNEG